MVKLFNKYDLYTKTDKLLNLDVEKYYNGLIEKYIDNELFL